MVTKLNGITPERNLAAAEKEEVELRRTLRNLKGCEKRISRFLNNIDDIAYETDAEGRVTFVNQIAETIVGAPLEDIIGKPFLSLFEEESQKRVQSVFRRTLKGESPEYELMFRNGRSCHFKNKPLLNEENEIIGVFGIARDITDRNNAEIELRISEARYRAVLEDMPALVSRFLPDGTLTFVNKAYADYFGYAKEDLIGHNFFKLIPPQKHKKVRKHFTSLGPTNPLIVYEHRLTRPDGTIFWQEWIDRALFDENNELVEYQSIGRDITDIKFAQSEKTRVERQLQQAQKMEAIGTLAGGIAHDFNNILGAIIGYAEIMEMFDITEDSPLKTSLDGVLKGAYRAKDLVEQILTFSRRTDQHRRPMQLDLIVKEGVKFLRASVPSTIEIRQKIEGRGVSILADPTQMHQVLMNLCTNASQAMREDGGTMTIGLAKVDLAPETDRMHPELNPGKYLELTAADTGPGMSPEVLERIFDPYFTTKKKGEGTGLGLAVVHGIVKGHDGAISVESEPGKGTLFRVLFPVFEAETLVSEPLPQTPAPVGDERILFVDDEKALADIGRGVLEKFGYDVVADTDSRKALRRFQAQPDRFDLLITDLTMPGLTGIELTKRILRIRPELPVILCTGYSKLMTPDKAKEMGIKAFIMKPLRARSLAETVRMVLDEKSQSKQAVR